MAQAGTSVVQTNERRWLRAYGGLPHPNILGGFLMAAAVLAISYYLSLYKKLEKLFAENQKKFFKKIVWRVLIGLIFYIIILVGLIFSFLKNRLVRVTLIGFLFLVYFLKQEDKVNIFSLLKLGLLSGLVLGSLFIIYQEPFLSRFQGKQKLEQQSLAERATYQKQSQNLREKRFWAGVGIGNYTLAVYQEVDKNFPARFYQPVHNVYLLVWSELGLIGLLFFYP